MQAFRILLHALRQVFGNLRQALLLSAGPLAVQAALVAAGVLIGATSQGSRGGPGLFVLIVALALALVFSLVWLAVRWHRFVLLDEGANLLAPPPRAAMLRYMGVSLLIGLAMVAAGLFIALVTWATAAGGGGVPTVIVVLVMAVLAHWLALILGAALPGAAIGAANPIRKAWNSLKPAAGPVFLLTIIGLVANFLVEAVGTAFQTSGLNDALVFGMVLVLYWCFSLVVLSVLTTLWGHYVEGRPLR